MSKYSCETLTEKVPDKYTADSRREQQFKYLSNRPDEALQLLDIGRYEI